MKSRSLSLWLALALAPALPAAANDARIEHIRPEALLAVPSFSQVTTATGGKLVFVSGQVAWDRAGKPQFPGDLEAQTRLTYDNVRIALAAAGARFEDVLKFNVYVKNLDTEKWKVISRVRNEVLKAEPRPASTMVGVTSLVYDELLIEIEAYALVKD